MTINLCNYKAIFGEPNQGLHAIRVMNIAVIDVVMTVIGAYLISIWSGWSLVYCLVGLFLLGIVMHRMFCVRTTVDRWLFRDKYQILTTELPLK